MPSRLVRHDAPNTIHFLTISCFKRLPFFRHDPVKLSLIEAMVATREKYPIRWIGYVIMPEHIHVVVVPQAMRSDALTPISDVLNYFKGRCGHDAKEALRDVWRHRRSLRDKRLDASATGDGDKPIWKPRGYDFTVVNDKKLLEKLRYIHNNPVRRGLVDSPEKWRWSSYRFYEFDDRSLIAMDWDGRIPFEF